MNIDLYKDLTAKEQALFDILSEILKTLKELRTEVGAAEVRIPE